MFEETGEHEIRHDGHERFDVESTHQRTKEHLPDLAKEEAKQRLLTEKALQRIAGQPIYVADDIEIVDMPPEVDDETYELAKADIKGWLSESSGKKKRDFRAGPEIGEAIENTVIHDGTQVMRNHQPYARYISYRQIDGQNQLVVQVRRDMPGEGRIPLDGLIRFERHRVGVAEPVYIVQFRIGGIPHTGRGDPAPDEISSEVEHTASGRFGLGKGERKKVKSSPLRNKREAKGYMQDLEQALRDLNNSQSLSEGVQPIAPAISI